MQTVIKVFDKPPFWIGLIACICGVISFFFKGPDEMYEPVTGYTGLLFAAVYWVITIIAVSRAHHLTPTQRMFWLIIVISAPLFGAVVYQIMHQQRNRIVT
jgi:drug/metabolite transporter (DMT)-like permease